MTEQTPEPVESGDYEVDETAVEPEKTTNDLSQQDDVEVAADQSPELDAGEYDGPEPDASEGGETP